MFHNRDLFGLVLSYLDASTHKALRLVSRDIRDSTQALVTVIGFGGRRKYTVTPDFVKLFPNVKTIAELFVVDRKEYNLSMVSKARSLILGDFVPDKLLPEKPDNLVIKQYDRGVSSHILVSIKDGVVTWMWDPVRETLLEQICTGEPGYIHDITHAVITHKVKMVEQIMRHAKCIRCEVSHISDFNVLIDKPRDGVSLEVMCDANTLLVLMRCGPFGFPDDWRDLTFRATHGRFPPEGYLEECKRFAERHHFTFGVVSNVVTLSR